MTKCAYQLWIRPTTLSESEIYSLPLLFISFCILFAQHAYVPGFFTDGNLYAALGQNAWLEGRWLIPKLSNVSYHHYFQHPPFTFILEGLYFAVTGISWTSARLFGVIWAFGIGALLYRTLNQHREDGFVYSSCLVLCLMPPFIKYARFPNLDLPLTFFIYAALFSYYKAYLTDKKKYWIATGLLMGLGLLTKGPPALVVSFAIFLHLLGMGKLRKLRSVWPWLSFLLGLVLFASWPLMIRHKMGSALFYEYFYGQLFGTIVRGRGNPDLDLFAYVFTLLKHTGPWFLLSVWGGHRIFKKRQDYPLCYLCLCLYISVLVPFSFVKWKYGHYLIPLYPALAVCAAFAIHALSDQFKKRFHFLLPRLILICGLVLLIFPLTNKSKRDQELFSLRQIEKSLTIPIESWGVVEGAYAFHDMSNFLAFESKRDAYPYTAEEFLEYLTKDFSDRRLFIISDTFYENHKDLLNSKFQLLVKYQNYHLMALIPKFMLGESLFTIGLE